MCVWGGGGGVGWGGLEGDVFSCSQVDGPLTERNCARYEYINFRGVARGSWGARDPPPPPPPPLVGLLLSKQPTIFRWKKRHDTILAVKAITEKPTFFKICFFVKYFRQRLLSLVNKGLHAAIIRLSPLIHEGKQRYKPFIVGDPRMVIW